MPLPGGSGITRINEADDISFSNLTDGDVITWDGTFGSWENAQGGGGAAASDQLALFSEEGTLIVGSGSGKFPFPYDATILGVMLAVGTAPTGAALIVDLHLNGTTIFTAQGSRPQIADGSVTSTQATPQVTSVTAGQYLTIDVDQVGSTDAGANLTVVVRYRAT